MLENAAAEVPVDAGTRRESLPLGDPPVDLVHLSRQCQGDPDLEEELLGLFTRLAAELVRQLSDPRMRLEQKPEIAHKLRGSALAIGAWRVARAAEATEAIARSSGGGGDGQANAASLAIVALQAAVADAIAEIERLRR